MGGGGKGKVEVTIGYKYYAGLHMVFCDAADALLAIAVGDKTAWTGNVTSNSTIYINQPNLFGGEEREGGIQGNVDVMFGRDSQGVNSYLRSKLGSNTPAFRGVVSLVAKQIYLAALNPYIKPWKARFRRIPASSWQPRYANIGGNANPVHIIYELITEHGLGQIDQTSFTNAARTLYNEKFGMSITWTGGSIEEFLQLILDHIGGMLFVNPTTGLFQIRLIRNDYNVSSLPVFDETSIKEMVSYQRIALADTINQLTIYYTDFNTGEERSICVQDLANFAAQGRIVSDERKYLGITNLSLATKVAMRDLAASAAMLSKLTIKVSRKAYNLVPGDVFVFKWPKLGIEQMVFRVGEVNYGTLTDSTITIDAIEDVYSLPVASYIEVQDPYWSEPVTDPTPCPQQRLYEVPYWDLVRSLSPADFDYLPKNEDVGFVGALGSRPTGVAMNYDFYTSTSSTSGYVKRDTENFCPIAFLSAPVGYLDTTFQIENGTDLDLVRTGNTFYAIIEDEVVRVNTITTSSVNVSRGCLDSVPKPHAAGVAIYFVSGWQAVDQTQRVAGQTIYGKLCPRTGRGVLDLAQAPTQNITLASRFDRPYPPAYLRVNNIPYPQNALIEGPNIKLDWYHRSRSQQTAYIVADTESNIGPEAGTTYTARILKASDNSVLASQTGITTNTYTFQALDQDNDIYVELWSVRDGYESMQKHRYFMQYLRTQRRLAQNGDIRVTEDGTIRIVEE